MTVSSSSSDDEGGGEAAAADPSSASASTPNTTQKSRAKITRGCRRHLPIFPAKRARSTRGGSDEDDDRGRGSNGTEEDQSDEEEGGSGEGSNTERYNSQAKRSRRSSVDDPSASVADSENNGSHTAPNDDAGTAHSGSSSGDDDNATLSSFRWLDVGEIVPATSTRSGDTRARRVHSKGIEIGTSHGNHNKDGSRRLFQVRPGSYVQLESPTPHQRWICRVLELWEPVYDDLDAHDEEVINIENEHDGKSHVTVASSVAAAARFRAQWLYDGHEIAAQCQGNWTGVLTKEELLQMLLPGEYVLSDHIDDNAVAAILRTVKVGNAMPPPDNNKNKNNNSASVSAGTREAGSHSYENHIHVRYHIRHSHRSWKLEMWTPERDASSVGGPSNGGHPDRAKAPHGMDESLSSDDDDARARHLDGRSAREELDEDGRGGDDSDKDSDDDTPSYLSGDDGGLAAMPEGEGSILRASISIGAKHQVPVPKFVQSEAVRSRNPQLVWKAHAVSEADLQHYLHELATLLNPHQRERGLTLRDPYSPRPSDETERAILQDARDHPPHHREHGGLAQLQPTGSPWIRTGSHVSSASRLSLKPNALLKECDADAALLFLHDHQYDAGAALAAVRADPARILPTLTRAFTRWEKRVFDEGFRGSQGSLSRVASAMDVPMTSVVDYWYRFKIPDQFRQYRDKKREQAIRMVECIEKRRYYDFAAAAARAAASGTATTTLAAGSGLSVADSGRHPPRGSQHWSDLSMNDVTGAVEGRRQEAKALLLEVDQRLGRAALGKVVSAVRVLIKSHSAAIKEELLATLGACPDLQRRFQEFLPAQG